ncbi:MAG: UDP-N-acetylmuramoyl-L-alanyl-D-glutamate--2,6-diaminopimelate ligase [Acidimicrobiales bacterium]|jgi:UDP-N-acetylmuramoyl-L-alanyl-D-glutamate--2,6-diaminopimelate ligase
MVADLLDGVRVTGIRGDATTTPVSSIEFDSRDVGPGALFCCVPGERTDGHVHAGDAVSRGATSLLCEHYVEAGVTQVRVAPGAVRPAMASVASSFYGHPSRSLETVGVTGTNGKTTVTHLVRSILEADGRPTGVIGTLGGARTTPESPELQRRLAELVAGGTRAVALEVSSHGLTQHRVDGIVFDVAAFTNLSRDHLDHHGSMEAYFAAKTALFTPERCRRAVVFVDDPWGARLLDRLDGDRAVPVRRSEATAVELSVGTSGFTWRGRRVELQLSGRFNVDNALVAAAVAVVLGVDESRVVEGLESAPAVPGRMQVVGEGSPVSVIVDYAHTPAGLEVALGAARSLAGHGRVVCVFGCGGDRDRGKRPEMGAVASAGADTVVLTSDNPRSEDPLAIIDEVRAGMSGGAEVTVEPDRAAAIRVAVGIAEPGDVVLVAGKGHEETQTAGGRTVPLDDRVEAALALADRFGGTAG